MSHAQRLLVMCLAWCALPATAAARAKGRAGDKEQGKPATAWHNPSVDDKVVVKFVETLMESEKYLKMIDNVDKKLNHLDASFHERSNSILKYMAELKRLLKLTSTETLEKNLSELKQDIDKLKLHMVEDPPVLRTDGSYMHDDSTMDNRLTFLENSMKNVMSGVDSIVSIISEVKNRQYQPKATLKSDSGGYNLDTVSIINEFRKSLYDQRVKKCDCNNLYDMSFRQGRVDRADRYPTDCFEIQMQGFNVSGIYKIKPDDMEAFYILCDLNTAGGGWTVIQNRFDGSQDFYKGWSEYKNGFGNLAGEFWLGLEKIHFLTNQKLYELRIEIETQHGQEAFSGFSVFTVGPEHEGFRISTLGTYYGTAGDSLTYHAGQKFSTYDMDNDEWKDGSCATEHGGAWWYKECDKSNLNGKFTTSTDENRSHSMYWISFKGPNFPLSKTKMMIRPLPASKPIDYEKLAKKSSEGPRLRHEPDTMSDDRIRDQGHARLPYRYEDTINTEAFFPNYA